MIVPEAYLCTIVWVELKVNVSGGTNVENLSDWLVNHPCPFKIIDCCQVLCHNHPYINVFDRIGS